MAFKDRLKEARENSGFSQKELAKLLKISNSTISGYEAGTSFPKTEILYKIFTALETTPNFLFQDEVDINAILSERKSSFTTDSPLPTQDEGYSLYDKLDNNDKAKIRGEMRQMLKADKYKKPTSSQDIA